MNEEEPDDIRVAKDMKCIDEDGGGTISRMEWIRYLANPEGGFDYETKKLFDSYDEDKTGTVDRDEFFDIILEKFKNEINLLSETDKVIARNHVRDLANDIFSILDCDGEGKLDWCEFKRYPTINKEAQ